MALTGNELLFAADDIAVTAYRRRKYGGKPFADHAREVSEFAEGVGYPLEVAAGCLLRRAVEGPDAYTIARLRKQGIPDFIIKGVVAIKGVDLLDHGALAKVKSHPIGHAVVFCDLSVTLADEAIAALSGGAGQEQRFDRVRQLAQDLGTLTPGLPTPEDMVAYLHTLSPQVQAA